MKKESNFNQMRPKGIYENVLKQRELDGIAFYDRNHPKFVDIKCPACGSSGDELFIKYGFNHRKCSNCETIYCSPRPTEKLLLEYYNTYDAPKMWTDLLLTADEKRKKIQYNPRTIEIVKQLEKEGAQRGGVALDIGSGAGTFALCLKETRFFSEVRCIDFSEDCIKVCREKGLSSKLGNISEIKDQSVDFITMNDLIEHLYDPCSTLKECRRVLKKGGFISIATPNGLGFDFLVMKENTRNITPPEHLNYFNPKSIHFLLSKCGFEPLIIKTPGKLDVEIVCKERKSKTVLKDKNEFLDYLLGLEEKILRNFQKFLSENFLSSHMLCMAKKIPY